MPITNDIVELSVWLAGHKSIGQPMGIEVEVGEQVYSIVFTGALEGDEMPFAGRLNDDGVAVLRRLFDSKDLFKLIPYSIPETNAALYVLLGLDPRVILPHFLGDVESVEFTIGTSHVVEEGLIDEARRNLLEWRAVQQMEMPAYYRQVAEPLARLMAVPPLGETWMVEYPDLLLRVIAKYSQEPALMQGIIDGDFPIQDRITKRLGEMYENADNDMAYASILWAALGGDSSYMAAAYPERFRHLDGLDLPALSHNLDKTVPSIRMMVADFWNEHGGQSPARNFKTLYGRYIPYIPYTNEGPGRYLDHVLSGTVQDLRNVFAVSASNLGATSVWADIIKGDEDVFAVHGSDEGDHYEFIQQLKALSMLGGPLNPVPMHPVITSLKGRVVG